MRLLLFILIFSFFNASWGMIKNKPQPNLVELCKRKKWDPYTHSKLITAQSVQEKDNSDHIALYYAVAWDEGDLVDRLCKASVNSVNMADFEGEQPLHRAAFFGNSKAVKKLLQYHADANAKTLLGKTPAHKAIYAEKNNIEVLRMLVKEKADLNLSDIDGLTPLHLAARNEKFDLFFTLIEELNANPLIINNAGETPLMIAQKVFPLLPSYKIHMKNKFSSKLNELTKKYSAQLQSNECNQTQNK